MSKEVLRYVGKGRFLIGIPAEDLTEDDIARLAARRDGATSLRRALLDSGLYVTSKPEKEIKSDD